MQVYALRQYELNSEMAGKRPEGGPGLLKMKNACRGAWFVYNNCPIWVSISRSYAENQEIINRMTAVPRRG